MGKVGRWVWAAMASRTAPLRETSTKIGPERRAPRTRYQMAILIQICHRARARAPPIRVDHRARNLNWISFPPNSQWPTTPL
jgi:hypothetical protein